MVLSPPWNATRAGSSLLEVCIATAFVAIMGTALIQCLLQTERFASTSRLLTSARTIVQRNINACSGIVFTGTSSTPALLALTSGSGEICNDDSNTATTQSVQLLGSGTSAAVSGTLRRIVTTEPVFVSGTSPNSAAVVRRITFQIDYDYLSRHYTYSETTLRSADAP